MNNNRALVVLSLVVVLFIAIAIKLFSIQILNGEELRHQAGKQQTKTETVKAIRGLIYDRNGELLAYNQSDVSFFVDLRMVSNSNKRKIAEKFSVVFGNSVNSYMKLMEGKKKTICIVKKARAEKALLLKDFKITGMFSVEDASRVYPYESLAAHVLGYVDNNYRGVNGIEKSVNKELEGIDGVRLVERDAIGQITTIIENASQPPVAGSNVYLTINKNYQLILEEELQKGINTYGGRGATGIIMDPNTGEILALANLGSYNPNNFWKFTDDDRRNRAITDLYEPGSTFKSFSMASLLDKKLCRENEKINTENGKYKFKNVNINDSHGSAFLTVKGVLEQSSNIGIAKLAQRIKDEDFYKYLRGFGFGTLTQVELPGEIKGNLKNPKNWNPLTKAFVSFGYEVTVTPMQLASAYCALVNGGNLYKPHIVKYTLDANNIPIKEVQPEKIRQVISEETSKKMREFLQGVVEEGTAKTAKLENVTAGGKTGTSQKLMNGAYSKSFYNTSFVGFFPVNNPKVVCLIVVDSPEQAKYGGLVAAPIFREVGNRIVKSNPTDFIEDYKDNRQNSNELKVIYASDPGTKDVKADENKTELRVSSASLKEKVMPDLTNYSLRDALSLLMKYGVKYQVKGSGKIISQSLKPGTKVNKNSVCIIVCKESLKG